MARKRRLPHRRWLCQGTTLVVPKAIAKGWWASAPAMSKPSRPSDPNSATGCTRTFFTTTRTAGGKSLFQTERMANLLIDVLRSAMRTKGIAVHEFAVMPNHVHILMTVPGEMSLEKAMQLIKGGFSFRANRELGFRGEIWQRGFSDVRVNDELNFEQHREYIENNPVKAGLVSSPEEFLFGSAYLKKRKHAGAKAQG
jgi:putative transposase